MRSKQLLKTPMSAKEIKNVQISKESMRKAARATAAFWMENKHWFFTLLFVCLALYAAYAWYTYVYREQDRIEAMRNQMSQKTSEKFDSEKFNTLLDGIQKRKTDFYIGAKAERNIFQ